MAATHVCDALGPLESGAAAAAAHCSIAARSTCIACGPRIALMAGGVETAEGPGRAYFRQRRLLE